MMCVTPREPASTMTWQKMNKEEIIDYDSLYDSMMKCKRGVMWKNSTRSFWLNDIENIYRMEKQLKDGNWKNGKPRPVNITFPKKRDGMSIPFRDRVFQRSINDNALYPDTTRSFILNNCACQKGKGTDFARDQMKKMLRRFYQKHGRDGYILQLDVKGYYPNMSHSTVEKTFGKHLDKEIHSMVIDVLENQYSGDIGYFPGSQMVQIAGITVLNDLDHYIKEKLHYHYYIRYMDDMNILAESKEELIRIKDCVEKELNAIGFELNRKKIKAIRLSKRFTFLGFDFRLTESGKVIMTVNSEKLKDERRYMRKIVREVKAGSRDKKSVEEHFKGYLNHIEKGNSLRLRENYIKYYKNLWR